MFKSFHLSRRRAKSARWFKRKISVLVLKKKSVVYLTKILLLLDNWVNAQESGILNHLLHAIKEKNKKIKEVDSGPQF